MRNWNQALPISFLLALSASVAFAQMGTGRVTGSVSDTEGNPIEGAIVTATGEDGKSLETTTDEKGKWGILGFRTGAYDFTVTASGYQPQAYKQQVRQTGRNASMDFVLERATVAGGGGSSMLAEANQLFEGGQYAEAIAKYEEILAAEPTVYQINYNIGNVYREMGDNEKALEYFNKVLAEEPLHTASLVAVGDVFVTQQKLDEAVTYFEKAIDQTTDEIVPFNVAEIYFNRGEADKALQYYQIAAERKPDWQDPHMKIAFAHLNKGDMAAARTELEKVVEMGPDTPQGQQAQQMLTSLPQ